MNRLELARVLLESLHNLSPKGFERQVAQLLEIEGYREVQVQGGSNDRGVDIICLDMEGRLVAVQCKRFATNATVSAMVVQHLVGMAVKSKAHRAMLVTTGSFTGPARTQANDFDIELIDGVQLASLIAAHPVLVAALGVGVGEVRSEQIRGEEKPGLFAPGTSTRRADMVKAFKPEESCADGAWYHRLIYRFPALTAENMATALEWGMKTLCPPTGEGCRYFRLWTVRGSWNNCSLRGRCPVGSIHIDPQPSRMPTDPASWQALVWDVWIDGRTGKGRLTQQGRPDIT